MSSAETTEEPQRDDPERFDPEAAHGPLIEAEHRARYWVAADLAAGRRVLDAGCGTGYGTEMLRDAGAAAIAGFDLADVAVQRTRERLGGDADVRVADIHALPYEAGSFDLVVCFEVLEHVTEQKQAVAELKRVLAPEGLLVISSPNPQVYPAGNPHHVHELTPDELRALLTGAFANVATVGQHTNLASSVRDAEGHVGGTPRSVDEPASPNSATYTIAVASDAAVPPLSPQLALAAADELRWLQSHLADVEAARDQEIRRLLGEVDYARSLYEEAKGQRAALNAALLDLEARNAVLADFERRYAEVRAERLSYEQDVQRVLAEKDAQIAAAAAPQRTALPFRAGRRLRWIVQRSLKRR